MIYGNNTKGLSFKSAFDELNASNQRAVKRQLKVLTGWSEPTFYSKIKSRTRLTILEQNVIRDVFATYGLDAWTGEKL